MPSRIRTRRIESDEQAVRAPGPRRRREPGRLGALRWPPRPALDLGSRIGLAADLQATAGNAATAAALGDIRTDKPQAPPDQGVKKIMDQSSCRPARPDPEPYDTTRMPLFRVQRAPAGQRLRGAASRAEAPVGRTTRSGGRRPASTTWGPGAGASAGSM